jgi:uncharacterized protein YndB with AHSA1/START domain
LRYFISSLLCLFLSTVPGPSGATDPIAVPAKPALDKPLIKLSQLIGGTWTNQDPKMVVEFRYEWAFGQTAIRGLGVLDKGGPHETPVEVMFGWDAAKKTVYYLDNHGGSSVYKGTVKLEDEELHYDFETLVGPPAHWRSVARFTDAHTYQFTILGEKEGKWVPVVEQTVKRTRPIGDTSRQVTEGIIAAPRAAVWAALTTKEGLESWNVAHAEVDLRVGGKMLTHYDPQGKIGDPSTIENVILCLDPEYMYAIQVSKPPEKFPFKDAVKRIWHVIYLEEVGPRQTRVRTVGLGYGTDEESQKLRAFFDKGNAYTIQKLQQRFARGQTK